ncbi:ribbon-helix-helix domain-containing protein [Helicobacter felis]|uniref:ribbon-helix-helix domain-containing protein n=1 Tax=Helicobacter felis TaxID=214 RepID=UPI000CF0C07F|nr:ribbon-helix-helix domain-containing protein [Helicobacter felis]
MDKKIPNSIQEALNNKAIQENTFAKKDKAKPGRKSIPEHLKQKFVVSFYLSKEEYTILENLANQEADSVGFFIKRYVLKNLVHGS